MSIRTAAKHSTLLTVLVVLGIVWTALTAVDVAATMNSFDSLAGPYVGQAFVGGAVGLLALGVIAFLLWYAYGELGHEEPVPETFPPEA